MVRKGPLQRFHERPNRKWLDRGGTKVARSRRAARVRSKTTLDVGFVGTDERFTAPLVDFSPFGLSVKTTRKVKIGTVFRLGIQIGTEYFRAAAVVRSQFPDGFAVEFLSMSLVDRELLRRSYQRLQMAARNASAG